MPQKHLFSECIKLKCLTLYVEQVIFQCFVFSSCHQDKASLFVLSHVFSVAFNIWIKLTFEKPRKCLLIPFAKE